MVFLNDIHLDINYTKTLADFGKKKPLAKNKLRSMKQSISAYMTKAKEVLIKVNDLRKDIFGIFG